MTSPRFTWLKRVFSFARRISILIAVGGLAPTTSSAVIPSTELKNDPIDRIAEIREALLIQDSANNSGTIPISFDKLAQWPNWPNWNSWNSWNNYWRNF